MTNNVVSEGGKELSGKTGSDPPEENAPEEGETGKKPPAKKRKKRNQTARFFIKLGIIIAVLGIAFTAVLGIHINHGNGMYPFIMDGDLLITYKLDPYMVEDAVLYKDPETGEEKVSRIAAKDANNINITSMGQILINEYVPLERVFYVTMPDETSEIEYPYQMHEGEYFLLNDFRSKTDDSRAFGKVTEDEFLGKVVFVFRRRGI